MLPRAVGLLAALSALAASAAAYEPVLTPQLVTEAIALGHSATEASRRAFHARYRVEVGIAPVDYLDVVTPFRRVVLAAQQRREAGQLMLSQREAMALTAAAGDAVEVQVELTFHPFNTFVGVPGYGVTLVDALDGAALPPREVTRIPRFGPRIGGLPLPVPTAPPAGSDPLTGGVMIAAFEARLVRPDGVYTVVVDDDGKDLARARVALGALR
jgi:hypothetical protein